MKKVLIFSWPLFVSLSLFAENEAPTGRGGQTMWQTLIMIGIALAFFYLILWRPEQKRRKKMEQQRKNLSKGDRVTAMGILGTIVRVEDNTVIMKMYDGSKIEMLKASITNVQPGSGEEKETASVQLEKPD